MPLFLGAFSLVCALLSFGLAGLVSFFAPEPSAGCEVAESFLDPCAAELFVDGVAGFVVKWSMILGSALLALGLLGVLLSRRR